MNTQPEFASQQQWLEEDLFTSGDDYFSSLFEGIKQAKTSIDFVSYIYQDDSLGKKVEALLIKAAERGVRVRVSVDGVGSQGWIFSVGARLRDRGVQVKVYHQLPWERLFSTEINDGGKSWIKLFEVANRRDHRKLMIVDNEIAWIGSLNISEQALVSIKGRNAWRELGIKLKGDAITYLTADFNYSWYSRFPPSRRLHFQALQLVRNSSLSPVCLNSTWKLRKFYHRNILNRIETATKMIWIANAYFVPSGSFIAALNAAVQRGVDVRIIIPLVSDVFFMPWVSVAFELGLLQAKVKIYGYQEKVFHAKYMLIDNWAMLGSSNLNQRSLLHDLEVDVTSTNSKTLAKLTAEYEHDIAQSIVITEQHLTASPIWKKVIGRIALYFKKYI